MKDTAKHQGLRNQLATVLQAKGITDKNVLNAIRQIPRHLFIDSSFEDHAYKDKAFPIAAEQTISQPYTVAFQSQTLAIKPGDKVLEIGTGSGYQAAILATLGANLYTIERHEALFYSARELLRNLGLGNIRLFHRDGYEGLKNYAPFNKIIVTAAAPKIPKQLCKQLEIGGIMIIPIGKRTQYMYRIERLSETKFRNEKLGKFRFVPFLEGIN